MIIDNNSILKYGPLPNEVIKVAKAADDHGRKFSQHNSTLYIFYKEPDSILNGGWIICDNVRRNIHNSIFYSTKENKFYVKSVKDSLLYDYLKEENYIKHSNQFFMHNITDDLISKIPSKKNFICE